MDSLRRNFRGGSQKGRKTHTHTHQRGKPAGSRAGCNGRCVLFSEGGLSLHAERSADAAAPRSLDSATQEHLHQERASLQSQMELLEKQKNEEIQNLKTSLIAEQQVGVLVRVVPVSKLWRHYIHSKVKAGGGVTLTTVFGVHAEMGGAKLLVFMYLCVWIP